MTYAYPGQQGWHHVNCQPAAFWAAKLYERGFVFDEALTEESRRVCEAGHYRTRGLVFVRPQTSRPA
jgi:hypothetical protein